MSRPYRAKDVDNWVNRLQRRGLDIQLNTNAAGYRFENRSGDRDISPRLPGPTAAIAWLDAYERGYDEREYGIATAQGKRLIETAVSLSAAIHFEFGKREAGSASIMGVRQFTARYSTQYEREQAIISAAQALKVQASITPGLQWGVTHDRVACIEAMAATLMTNAGSVPLMTMAEYTLTLGRIKPAVTSSRTGRGAHGKR